MEEKHEQNASGVYTAYGMSRKNPFLWGAVISALLFIAVRIVHYSLPAGASGRIGSTFYTVILAILTIGPALWFAIELITESRDRLYKTAKPVFLFCVFLIVRACVYFPDRIGPKMAETWWILAIRIILFLAIYAVYRRAVSTGGRKKINAERRRTVAVIVFVALYFGLAAYALLFDRRFTRAYVIEELSIVTAVFAAIMVLTGMEKRTSDRPLPMCGDRNDGRRVRTLDPMSGVAVYIMPERNVSSNLFRDSFDAAKADAYIRAKRAEGLDHFGIMHLMLAAYARTVSQRPAVNRFISGQRIYSRDDSIEVSMVIKKDMSLDGSETIITIYLDPNDTAYTVYEKFDRELEKVKSTQELDSSFDKLAGLINMIPGVALKFTIWLLKALDYFGHLPRFLTKLSPFHGSIFITSMGSLGIPPVFHHLYDFGNIPAFLAFGMRRRANELNDEGEVVEKRYYDFTVNTDERICDGFYYASAFKYFKRCMMDPQRLDTPPEEVVHDVE